MKPRRRSPCWRKTLLPPAATDVVVPDPIVVKRWNVVRLPPRRSADVGICERARRDALKAHDGFGAKPRDILLPPIDRFRPLCSWKRDRVGHLGGGGFGCGAVGSAFHLCVPIMVFTH